MFVNNPGISLRLVTSCLNLIDVLIVESTFVSTVLNSLLYFPKMFQEPPMQSYAKELSFNIFSKQMVTSAWFQRVTHLGNLILFIDEKTNQFVISYKNFLAVSLELFLETIVSWNMYQNARKTWMLFELETMYTTSNISNTCPWCLFQTIHASDIKWMTFTRFGWFTFFRLFFFIIRWFRWSISTVGWILCSTYSFIFFVATMCTQEKVFPWKLPLRSKH